MGTGQVPGEVACSHVLEEQGLRQRAEVFLQAADEAHGDERVHAVPVEGLADGDLRLGQLQLLGEQPQDEFLRALVRSGHGGFGLVLVRLCAFEGLEDAVGVAGGQEQARRGVGEGAFQGLQGGGGAQGAHAEYALHVGLGVGVDAHPAVGPDRPGGREGAAVPGAFPAAPLALLGEVVEEGVGEGVVALAGVAEGRGRRGERDEVVQRFVRGRLVEQHGAVHLGGEDGVGVRALLGAYEPVPESAGRVHDAADRAVRPAGLCHQAAYGGRVGDVGDDHQGAEGVGAGPGLGTGGGARGEHDASAGDSGGPPCCGDVLGDEQAEGTGAAGDDVRSGTGERGGRRDREVHLPPGAASPALRVRAHLGAAVRAEFGDDGVGEQAALAEGQDAEGDRRLLQAHGAGEGGHSRLGGRRGRLGVDVQVAQRVAALALPGPQEGQGRVEAVLHGLPGGAVVSGQVDDVDGAGSGGAHSGLGIEAVAERDSVDFRSRRREGRGHVSGVGGGRGEQQDPSGGRELAVRSGRGLPDGLEGVDDVDGGHGLYPGRGSGVRHPCGVRRAQRPQCEGLQGGGHLPVLVEQGDVEGEGAARGGAPGRGGVRVTPLGQRGVQPDRAEGERQVRCRARRVPGALDQPARGLQGGVQQRGVEGVRTGVRALRLRQAQRRQRLPGALGDLLDDPEGGTVGEAEPDETVVAVGPLLDTGAAGAYVCQGDGGGPGTGVVEPQGAAGVHRRVLGGAAHLEGRAGAVAGDTDQQRVPGVAGGEPDRCRPHQVVDAAHLGSPGGEFARQSAHLQIGHAGQHQVAADDVVAQEELLARQRLGEALFAEGGDVGVQEGGVQTGAGLREALPGGDPVPGAGERVGGQVDATPGCALVQVPPVDVGAVQPGGGHGLEVAPVRGDGGAGAGGRHLGGAYGGGAPGQVRGELGAQGRGAVGDAGEPVRHRCIRDRCGIGSRPVCRVWARSSAGTSWRPRWSASRAAERRSASPSRAESTKTCWAEGSSRMSGMGGSSITMCAPAPPKPKELTPPRRGRSAP